MKLEKRQHFNSIPILKPILFSPSILEVVTGIFQLTQLPSPTMALWSTQLLTEISTENLLGVKRGKRVRLSTSRPSVTWLSLDWHDRQMWKLEVSQHYQPLRPVIRSLLLFLPSVTFSLSSPHPFLSFYFIPVLLCLQSIISVIQWNLLGM